MTKTDIGKNCLFYFDLEDDNFYILAVNLVTKTVVHSVAVISLNQIDSAI